MTRRRRPNPNPYLSVDLKAEFRSPRHRTLMVYGFWDGGRRMVIRFAPNEAGDWVFRITSNLQRFEGKQGALNATSSEAPGFLRAANVHHWAYTDSNKLISGWATQITRSRPLPAMRSQTLWTPAHSRKFTHIRGFAVGPSFNPEQPDSAFFRELDDRVRYMNQKGVVYDMILARTFLPVAAQRDRYVRLHGRPIRAFNVTWLCVQAFEDQKDGRALTREWGLHGRDTTPISIRAPRVRR